ncbi:MAG: cytochrome c biogenesis CcdA family protein [Romboutsia sp.]
MQYLILFLEGIITFISPCILPMIPIYISYFMGDSEKEDKKLALVNSLGFVSGFTIVFTLLGAGASSFGKFINEYIKLFNILGGVILIILGISYMGIINISFIQRQFKLKYKIDNLKFTKSIVFGAVFAIGWTPCVGTFLGSALMIAAQSQHATEGVLMLFIYSLGLGIPFVISAILIDSLKGTFNFIKRNYKIINTISGIFLIIIGIAMSSGYLGKILSVLSF